MYLVSSSTASCYIDLIIYIGILSKGLIYIPVTDIDKWLTGIQYVCIDQ